MSAPIAKYPPEFIVDKDEVPSLYVNVFEKFFDDLKDAKDLNLIDNIDKVIYNEILKDINIRILIKISNNYANTDGVTDIIELTIVLIEAYKHLCDIPFIMYIKDNSIISDVSENAPEELTKRYEYNLLEIGKMMSTYINIVNGSWYVQNDTFYSF
jgi:hypothetical protein